MTLLVTKDDPFTDPEYIAQALNDFKSKDWSGKKFSELITHFRSTFKAIPLLSILH